MPELYSFSHCFTMMPTDAADKLKMRLENQRVFSQIAERGAGRGSDWCRTNAGCVALTKLGLTEKLLSCAEICWSAVTTGSGPEGVRS